MSSEHLSIFEMLGVPEHYNFVAGAAFSALILTIFGLYIRAKLRDPEAGVLPAPKFSFLNLGIEVVQIFRNLLRDMIGHGAEKYLPILLTTFLIILISNLSGFVPGLSVSSLNINNNLAMAGFIFVAYMYFGIREHGFSYVKQFTGGLPAPGYGTVMTTIMRGVAAMIVVIEVCGHIVRPFSLSLRLWGTMNGDHALMGIFEGFEPLIFPCVAMALGLLVSVVQALVFALLSMVYIKLAVSHDH